MLHEIARAGRADISALQALVSAEFTQWGPEVVVTQKMINTFAMATGDHQWPHVDLERAAKGPFGATVAHGFLVLGLLYTLRSQDLGIEIEGSRQVVHAGGQYEFKWPVKVGAFVRSRHRLAAVEEQGNNVSITYAYEVRASLKSGGAGRLAASGRINLLYI